MRLFISLLLVLSPVLYPVVSDAAYSVVVSHGESGPSSHNGFTTSAFNTTGASTIFCGVTSASGTPPTLTDSASNTYYSLGTKNSSGARATLFVVKDFTPSASLTVTVSGTGIFAAVGCIAFSGSATASNVTSTASTSTGTTLSTGSIAVQSGDVAVSVLNHYAGTFGTIDNGFTAPIIIASVAGQSYPIVVAYKINPGTVNPQWSWSPASQGDTVIGTTIDVLPPHCIGSSPSWTASGTNQADMDACYNAASANDTVNVPAGSGTWGFMTQTKNIKWIGAANHATVISWQGHWTLSGTTGTQISGFDITMPNATRLICVACLDFRVDHNLITLPSWNGIIETRGGTATLTRGLFDHNTCMNCRILISGDGIGPSPNGKYQWSQPLLPGTNNAVYVEDNIFNENDSTGGIWPNTIDGSWGLRVVFRFNTLNSARLEIHGMQSAGFRGSRLWEFYGNTFKNDIYFPNYSPILVRGGTGWIFHNTTDGKFAVTQNIRMDGPRQASHLPAMGVWGDCDGTSQLDENEGGLQGYLCRDQIGASTDASLWTGVLPAPAQDKFPAYMWKNTRTDTSAELGLDLNCAPGVAFCDRMTTQIVRNRDYYGYASSFDGTVGVGEGTLASRPATCTTGVGYWATDQGSWNTSVSNPQGVNVAGADGVFSQCTATNTWTVVYTPYTYPHPFNVSPFPDLPTAPTNLRKIGLSTSTSCTITWDESGLSGLLGYKVLLGTGSNTYDYPNYPITKTAAASMAAHQSPRTHTFTFPIAGIYYISVRAYSATADSANATEITCTSTGLSRTAASTRSAR